LAEENAVSVQGVDISHHNGSHPVPQLHAAGMQFCGIKAWEGDSPDPEYENNAADCIACGMPYWAYVYLHASDTPRSMQDCFDFIGEGMVLAPDWEEAGTPAEIVEDWMDAYENAYGREGMNYYGLYPPDSVTPRIAAWPKWFARYNSYAGIDDYAVWQYSGTGRIAGLSGQWDLDELAEGLSIEAFAGWLKTGGAPPKPSPHPAALPILRMGDSGPAVRVLQRFVGVPWLTNDGVFGKATDYIVRGFQETEGLFVDGVVGPDTWASLRTTARLPRRF
jgi:hypothetical protein